MSGSGSCDAVTLPARDLDDLRYARTLLEHPSLAARLTSLLGTPIEKGLELLPANWSAALSTATRVALTRALDVAVATMDDRGLVPAANWLHKITLAATGAAGGALGLSALAIELPVSTTVMLRSIADIGRSEGEQIRSIESRLACLEVFALGGRLRSDDAGDVGYFAIRTALALHGGSGAVHCRTRRGVKAPALVKRGADRRAIRVVVSKKPPRRRSCSAPQEAPSSTCCSSIISRTWPAAISSSGVSNARGGRRRYVKRTNYELRIRN